MTRPISRVQFYNGAALLGETTAVPYAWMWTNVAAGLYTLSARAIYDATKRIGAVSHFLQHRSPATAFCYLKENDGKSAQAAINAIQFAA